MANNLYRYSFSEEIKFQDVQESLILSVLAAESLYGRSAIRMDAYFHIDEKTQTCVVDASSDVGRHIARIFTGFLINEFGEETFSVHKIGGEHGNST